MPVGFRTETEGGVLQIDASYKNFQLFHSGSFVINNTNIQPFLNKLRARGQFAVVAWNFYGSYGSFPLVGSYYNGVRHSTLIDSQDNSTAQYYIFDYGLPNTSSNFGLEIYDENRDLAFSSNEMSLKILDYFESTNFPANSVPTDTLIYTNNTGRPVAYLPTTANHYYDNDGQDIEIHDLYIRSEGNKLIGNSSYYILPMSGVDRRTAPATFNALVVDTTGLPLNYDRV